MNQRLEQLIYLLSDFQPADDAEVQYRQRMLSLAQSAADPFGRQNFQPGHFTASAFVLSPDSTQLLLILHSKLGLWLQPGGHIDPEDESVFAAVQREVLEEVGIADLHWVQGGPSLFDLDIHTIPARPGKEPAHEHFDVRVLLRAPTRDFVAGSDASDARWVETHSVTLEGSDESVMRAVRKIRSADL